MKITRLLPVGLIAAGVLAGGSLPAFGDDVLKSKGCVKCHDAEKKKVGPAFKDSAAKYKGNKDAAGAIVAKMKEGKGHPKVAGSDDELKAAVEASLSAK
jgi:cytochrome c